MFQVVKVAENVRNEWMQFKTKSDAYRFCADHFWSWTDNNNFEWQLDVEEVKAMEFRPHMKLKDLRCYMHDSCIISIQGVGFRNEKYNGTISEMPTIFEEFTVQAFAPCLSNDREKGVLLILIYEDEFERRSL